MRVPSDFTVRLQPFVLSLSISFIILGIAGCGGSSSTTLSNSGKAITGIALSPSTASVTAGASQQFTATATYSDRSTADVTSAASWTAASKSVVNVKSNGMVSGLAAGSTTVTASLGGVSGTAVLTVNAPTVTSIAVSPATANVAAGATQQFTATATYSDGTTTSVTSTARWTSSNVSVATITPAGLASAVAGGSTAITASLGGVSATASLTVSAAVAPTLTSIALTPNPGSVGIGAKQQFTATGTYNNGTTGNVTSTATWKSANTAVATISPAGLATGVAAGSTTVTASLNGLSATVPLTVTTAAATVTSIAISPSPVSFAMNATQQFTATATYANGSTANVTSTAAWTAANTSVVTVTAAGLGTAEASGTTTVTASLNGVSGTDAISVTIAPGTAMNVSTWHFDNNRSGLNASEQSLTPTNVTPQTFGKLFSYLVDGYAYAEPLLVSNVTINGSAHNVLYVATEHDSVYAFDADNYGTGAPLWQVSLLHTGEKPLTDDPDLQPYDGITSTPVIDATSNTMYVVSKQASSTGATFRLNALDITTGAQKFGGPVTIQASVPGTNSSAINGIAYLTTACIQRSALLLANGNVYLGFGSCHTGWLLAYNAQTLAQVGVFNASPNLDGESEYASAGGIWMGSGGPVADSAGNVYVATGNGPWDGNLAWGDSVLKFDPLLTKVQDYFTPEDYQYMDCNDTDLNSGGVMLIPGTTQLMAGGKSGRLYLMNTTNLGKEQVGDVGATQRFWFESDLSKPYVSQPCVDSAGSHTTYINSYENFGIAAYFNGSVYLGISPTSLTAPAGVRQFTYSTTPTPTLTPGTYTTPSVQENDLGTTPFISANGTNDGILWMIDEGQPIQSPGAPTSATLRAYAADSLGNEVYNSSVNTSDVPGYGIKFTSPIVANGKVYISTGHDIVTTPNPQGEIDVYGLH